MGCFSIFRISRRWLAVVVLSVSVTGVAGLNISQVLLIQIQSRYGLDAKSRIMQWQELMQSLQGVPESEKLKQVNAFFNRVEFVDDIYHWGENDYWATPFEFLATDAGDCEDFSIAKYYTLIELGVPDDKLRLTYVKALQLNQSHMVLTYFSTQQSIPLVLDNLKSDIVPATERNDLVPVYSFNGSGLWLAKARGRGRRVGESGRLSLWQELKQRMRTRQFKTSMNHGIS